MNALRDRYGPVAVVTGAAAGIGAAFAEALAREGFELVLVDVNEQALASVAERVRGLGAQVRVLAADLSEPADVARVTAVLDEPATHLLVNNAGLSQVGEFIGVPLATHRRTLAVNCAATLELVYAAARAMAARGRGGIIILSSNSGVLHTPFVAHYAGTKAYALALAEALYEELRERGVDVLAVIPGLTRTPGLASAGLDERQAGALLIDAAHVATDALLALGRSPRVMPNPLDRLGASLLNVFMPRGLALSLNAKSMRRLFPGLKRS
jgi:short-subunit dehydrogenase